MGDSPAGLQLNPTIATSCSAQTPMGCAWGSAGGCRGAPPIPSGCSALPRDRDRPLGHASERCKTQLSPGYLHSAPLTALHLELLVPTLQAIDLRLLVGEELLQFVLHRLRQLVQLGALQHLLQHRRHVCRARARRGRRGEGRQRPGSASRRGSRRGPLAVGFARADPPRSPAARPWEGESRVSPGAKRRRAAPALLERAHSGLPLFRGDL